jgi:hypothetical protein
MRPFLEELKATLDCGIWSPVVLGLLVIPDACGAVEYHNLGNGERYKNWYDKYVGVVKNSKFRFDGEVLWQLRNAMMHETSLNLSRYGYDRVIFALPNRYGVVLHMNVSSNNVGVKETALTVFLPTFYSEMRAGVEKWLNEIETDDNTIRHDLLGKLIQYRPKGLYQHILGVAVVA